MIYSSVLAVFVYTPIISPHIAEFHRNLLVYANSVEKYLKNLVLNKFLSYTFVVVIMMSVFTYPAVYLTALSVEVVLY